MRKTVLLASLLCLAPLLQAADAQLASTSGKVSIKTGGAAPYAARQGDPLYYGDEVIAAPDALAHVVFKDGTAVLVKGGTTVALKGKKGDTLLDFSVGEFLIGLKKKLQAGERFRVQTPAAVAAVRGTLFWGLSDPATKDTTYACFESAIEITAQGKSVTLTPGQKVRIPFNQAPEAVASAADIPANYVDTFKVKDSLQGLEALMPPAAPPAPAAPAQTPAAPPAEGAPAQ